MHVCAQTLLTSICCQFAWWQPFSLGWKENPGVVSVCSDSTHIVLLSHFVAVDGALPTPIHLSTVAPQSASSHDTDTRANMPRLSRTLKHREPALPARASRPRQWGTDANRCLEASVLLLGNDCVCLFVSSENNPCIKHYHIKETNDSPKRYYVAEKYVFDSIPLLIKYHQYNGGGKFLRTQPGRDPHKEKWEEMTGSLRDSSQCASWPQIVNSRCISKQANKHKKTPKTETNKKVPSAWDPHAYHQKHLLCRSWHHYPGTVTNPLKGCMKTMVELWDLKVLSHIPSFLADLT